MAAVAQSFAAVIPVVSPDAGVVVGSEQLSGAPAVVLLAGQVGTVTTAGSDDTTGSVRQSFAAVVPVVGGFGVASATSAPGASVRQSSAAVVLVVGRAGTVTVSGAPPVLNRLGGRLLRTGVLSGALV